MTIRPRAGEPGRPRRLLVAPMAALAVLAACVTGAPAVSQQSTNIAAVDFDAAMRGLNFSPSTTDGNLDASSAGNGILDADEMALVAAILKDASLDLKAKGGVDHASVAAAFAQAQSSATADFQKLASRYPTSATVGAGYAMLGEASLKSYSAMAGSFGAPMKGDYSLAIKAGKLLAHDGDADGDGVSNRAEYLAFIGKGRDAYIKAALNPEVMPDQTQTAQAAKAPMIAPGRKIVGVVLYPGFEVLDVFGPVEMWAYVPDFQVIMISQNGGAVKSAQGVSTVADYSFANAPQMDIMMVPGGTGTRTELNNPVFLDFIRMQNEKTQLTTSVCTGSALLAKAGLLKGHKATSNKNFFSLATQQDPSVDWQGKARWVEDGKFITSSGVSAGTDMALGLVAKLYGKERASLLAHSLEYEWNDDPTNDPFAVAYTPAGAQ
jgi:putative intracellular protease/amidase